MTLNLWLINQFANTPDQPGHTRQYEIAEGLSNKGWEVNVFSSDFNLSTRKFLKNKSLNLFKTETYKCVKWTWLKVLPYKINNWQRIANQLSFCGNLFFHLLILGSLNKINNQKPKLILASTPQLPAAYVSLIIANIFQIPFLLEVRDLWPQVLIDQGGKSPKSILVKLLFWIEKELYKSAKVVVILSKGLEEYVYKKGAKKVYWLPNGPDKKFFIKNNLNDFNKDFSIDNPFKIIYAGAHGEANDLKNIIEAAKLLQSDPVKFIFIGDGPCKPFLKELSKAIKNIDFLDPIPKIEIPFFMSKGDAILVSLGDIPLFRYGVSPNKLYDAYALGKPVITTIPGIINDEVEVNNLGVTCAPGSPSTLSNQIRKLINLSPQERFLMGERSKKLAKTIYSRKIIIEKYLKIIDNIKAL